LKVSRHVLAVLFRSRSAFGLGLAKLGESLKELRNRRLGLVGHFIVLWLVVKRSGLRPLGARRKG